jgi:hypothetical protein
MPVDHSKLDVPNDTYTNKKGKKGKKHVPGKEGKEGDHLKKGKKHLPVILKTIEFDEPITIRVMTQPGVKLAQHTCVIDLNEETDTLLMFPNGCIQCEQHGGLKIEYVNSSGAVIDQFVYP